VHGDVPTPRVSGRQNNLSQRPPWASNDKVIVPRDEGLPEAALTLLFVVSSPLPRPAPPLVASVVDSLPQRPGPTCRCRHRHARHHRLPSPPPSPQRQRWRGAASSTGALGGERGGAILDFDAPSTFTSSSSSSLEPQPPTS
jgi:hypothetical protein